MELESNFLISYWYFAKRDLPAFLARFIDPPPRLMADSGAFSAMTSGAGLDLGEYIVWVQENGQHFDRYANLDIIGDAERTWQNQQAMEAAGLAPMPVFHVNEEFRWLERYLALGYPVVALGVAGQQSRRDAVNRWLAKCFKLAEGSTTRYHGFALTSASVMATFPFISVDSSSPTAGVRYGVAVLWDTYRKEWLKLKVGDPDWYKHAALVRDYGYTPEEFARREHYSHVKLAGICGLAWQLFAHDLRLARGGETAMYLVDTDYALKHLPEAHKATTEFSLYGAGDKTTKHAAEAHRATADFSFYGALGDDTSERVTEAHRATFSFYSSEPGHGFDRFAEVHRATTERGKQ